MKVAVIGATGQLGHDVVAAFRAGGDEVVALGHGKLEVSSPESVRDSLETIQPQVVVNTAAFHNVEKCEADPAQAFAVNGLGARNVAEVTAGIGAKLFHISTDYVFGGEKHTPYTEEDLPHPVNAYGATKLCGEHFVQAINPRHFVLRVSALYGPSPCRAKGGLNFVELMLKLSRERDELRVVNQEKVSPTPTADVAKQIVVLSRSSDYGLYHATSEGSCSWYEFARAIFEITGTNVRVQPAAPGEFPAKVPRPLFSVLENQSLKNKSMNVFRHWRLGLENYLSARNQTRPLTVSTPV